MVIAWHLAAGRARGGVAAARATALPPEAGEPGWAARCQAGQRGPSVGKAQQRRVQSERVVGLHQRVPGRA